jgi:hypothetical protein
VIVPRSNKQILYSGCSLNFSSSGGAKGPFILVLPRLFKKKKPVTCSVLAAAGQHHHHPSSVHGWEGKRPHSSCNCVLCLLLSTSQYVGEVELACSVGRADLGPRGNIEKAHVFSHLCACGGGGGVLLCLWQRCEDK